MENGKHKVNLSELGYQKLLGRGNIQEPMIIEVKEASKKAKEKVERMGGKVVVI